MDVTLNDQITKFNLLGQIFAIGASQLDQADPQAVALQKVANLCGSIVTKMEDVARIPISNQLAEALAIAEGRMVFLVNGCGRPFTANGVGNWMRDRCDEAALPQCSCHGLRKLISKRLAQAGVNENTISAILGHKNNQQAALYTREANREKLASEGIKLIDLKNGSKI